MSPRPVPRFVEEEVKEEVKEEVTEEGATEGAKDMEVKEEVKEEEIRAATSGSAPMPAAGSQPMPAAAPRYKHHPKPSAPWPKSQTPQSTPKIAMTHWVIPYTPMTPGMAHPKTESVPIPLFAQEPQTIVTEEDTIYESKDGPVAVPWWLVKQFGNAEPEPAAVYSSAASGSQPRPVAPVGDEAIPPMPKRDVPQNEEAIPQMPKRKVPQNEMMSPPPVPVKKRRPAGEETHAAASGSQPIVKSSEMRVKFDKIDQGSGPVKLEIEEVDIYGDLFCPDYTHESDDELELPRMVELQADAKSQADEKAIPIA